MINRRTIIEALECLLNDDIICGSAECIVKECSYATAKDPVTNIMKDCLEYIRKGNVKQSDLLGRAVVDDYSVTITFAPTETDDGGLYDESSECQSD